MVIIAIVYCVDNMLARVTTDTVTSDEVVSAPSNSWFEIASIVVCVLVPAVYFNIKSSRNNSVSESKLPTANDASARLRAKVNKSPATKDANGDHSPAKIQPLSEQFRQSDDAIQRPQMSKQAVMLARWNQ